MKISSHSIKKFIAYFLAVLVMVFTVIALLGIWDIINLEEILRKLIGSLIIVISSSAVILFVFTVLYKDEDTIDKQGEEKSA